MDEAGKQAIFGTVRSVLIALGGVLAAKGWVSSGDVELYAGAIVIVLGAAWSIWDKFQAESAAKAREATALNAGIALSNADPNQTPPVATSEAQSVIKAQAPPATK